MTAADTNRTILAVWRIEQPRLITSLARMLRDVPLAEDLTQEALLAALEHWPATGISPPLSSMRPALISRSASLCTASISSGVGGPGWAGLTMNMKRISENSSLRRAAGTIAR